ncbi:hypothetical protein HDV05_007925 [Chytridiales sp. JEL 0842]|nr:hypothetical protein HDV05_007925 [Chytridiales sp. JEL 0842]
MLLSTTTALIASTLLACLHLVSAQEHDHSTHNHTTPATTGSLTPATISASTAAMNRLCAANSTTSGIRSGSGVLAVSACSMRSACQSSNLSTESCSDFVLLKHACTFDSMFVGTEDCEIVQTCLNDASCNTLSTIPFPTSLEIQSYIYAICTSMSMEDCAKCGISFRSSTVPSNVTTALSLNCNTLDVYGSLCRVHEMSSCDSYTTTCTAASTSFPPATPLCLGASTPIQLAASSASGQNAASGAAFQPELNPVMKMFFHTGISEYILFFQWVPRTPAQFFGACMFTIVLGVLFYALGFLRMLVVLRRLKKLTKKNSEKSTTAVAARKASQAGSESTVTIDNSIPMTSTTKESKFNLDKELFMLAKASLKAFEAFLSYVLMLIVMTYNIWLILCACLGLFLGSYIFDRREEYMAVGDRAEDVMMGEEGEMGKACC